MPGCGDDSVVVSLNGDQPAPEPPPFQVEPSDATAALAASTLAFVVVLIVPRGCELDPKYSTSRNTSSLFGSVPELIVPYTVTVTLAPVTAFQIA